MLSLVTAETFDLHLEEVPIPLGKTLNEVPYGDAQRIEKDYPGINPGEEVGAYYDRMEQAGTQAHEQGDPDAEQRHTEELAAQTDALRKRYQKMGYPEYGVLWKTQYAGKDGWINHIPIGSGVVDPQVWKTSARSFGEPDQEDFTPHGFSGKWYRNVMVRYKELGGRIKGQQPKGV